MGRIREDDRCARGQLRRIRGKLVSLVGRNGVGKTTTLMAIAGISFGRLRGSVRFNGTEVLGLAPERLFAPAWLPFPRADASFER